jgi:WhiB family redox-sensing transcriptional regulator
MIKETIIPSNYPDFEEYGLTPCSKVDPDVFFPDEFSNEDAKPAKPSYSRESEAKLVCASCPYQLRCLEYALKNQDEVGIWGGTTELDRRKLRNRRRRSLNITPSKHR